MHVKNINSMLFNFNKVIFIQFLVKEKTQDNDCFRKAYITSNLILGDFNIIELQGSSLFCLVAAKCIPSQSAQDSNQRFLIVVLDKQLGTILTARCTCKVGYVILNNF